MYLGSDEFNNAIENTSGNAPKIRVTLEDGTTLDNIKSIKFYGGSNDSDDVSIGTTNMARIDVTAFTDKMLTNNEIFLEQGIELADGVVEYMPIGYFTVQKPSGDIDEVSFTAYDRMQKFEKPYSSSLAYPTTSALILDELCQICGIELVTTLGNAIEVTENLKGYTCREVLGYIASMHGYFACIDRYGKLNLRWYSDTPIEKSLKKIWHFEKSQDNFEIAKVEIVKDSETKYESGNGITTLHNSNPLATQEIAGNVFAKLGGFSYSVGEIEILDDARLDPWDMVSIEYYDGKTYNIPCMTLEHDFKAYSTTVKSVGKSESENEYRFTGPTIQYLNRMATELLVANRVIATKVDADYVNSVAITTENFDAKVAEIKELVVEEIDGKYANIDLANIDIANINVGKIGELFAKVGLIDRATIVEGHITGFLDAVEVNANKITAGTLVADRILLSGGENGVLYALNNLGELTSTNVDSLDGYVLTDRTINADKLIANSITANELDVNQIFGNEAVLNKLVSQEIFSDAVATNTVVVGASKDAKDALDLANSTNTASGSPILLTDSADGVLIDFKAYGKSIQDGTPIPDSPIRIKSVGDRGYFDGELLQGYYNSSNGTYATNNTSAICSKNSIPCKDGDNIKVIYPTTLLQIRITYYKNGTYVSFNIKDNVSEASFTVPTNATEFHISIIANDTVSPTTAKPITVTINGKYALIVKSKGKNLLQHTVDSQTINGVTFTVNDDKSVTVNGKATDNASLYLTQSMSVENGKTYIVNGAPSSASSTSYCMVIQKRLGATFITSAQVLKEGLSVKCDGTFDTLYVGIAVFSGQSVSDVTFYPMVSIEGGTYEPYKETVSYIPLNEPLRGINDITDEIDLESGVKISKIKETTVAITKIITMNNGNVAGLIENVSDKYNGRAGAYCSKCVYDSNISPSFSSNTFYENPVNFVIVGTPDDTLESLKEKYDGASLYYVLAEPITESIEPVDITTYKNVTYLTASDNAEMEIKYYRNTPTGIQLARLAGIEQDNSRLIANWASDNDITLIDGAKIYTGSITADKIDVDDLFAQEITATGSITGATLVSIKDEDAKIVIDKGEITIYNFDTRGEGGFYEIGSLYNAGNAVGASGAWIFDSVATSSGANLDTINSRFKQYFLNSDTSNQFFITTDTLENDRLYLMVIQESTGKTLRHIPSFAIVYIYDDMWINLQKSSDSKISSVTYNNGKITVTVSEKRHIYIGMLSLGY